MFTLLKVVGERARSPTTFVMITNQKCQLYRERDQNWVPGMTNIWPVGAGHDGCMVGHDEAKLMKKR